MSVTLNGIAQGYITDRLANQLRSAGFEHLFVNLGEFKASGRHADGREWQLGIADPTKPSELRRVEPLSNLAAASSGGYGTTFEPSGRFHHIFDPRTGTPSNIWRGVTVFAERATIADAASTALINMEIDEADTFLRRIGARRAIGVASDGREVELIG